MINAGMGATHVNAFLARLDIPPVCSKTIKRREKEISQHIHDVASETCTTVLEQELSLLKEKERYIWHSHQGTVFTWYTFIHMYEFYFEGWK